MILDLGLPDGNGQEVGLHLIDHHPNPAIIILSSQLHDFTCDRRLLPNIHAFIEKTSAYKELAKAIGSLGSAFQGNSFTDNTAERVRMMSAREREVFLLIGKGKSSREISTILSIGTSTVESHRKAIAQCLGTSGGNLVRMAAIHCFKSEEGLFETQPGEASQSRHETYNALQDA